MLSSFGKGRLFIIGALLYLPLLATETLPTVKVLDVREKLEQTGKLKETLEKTEVISQKKIQKKQAQVISQAIENEPGIDAVTGCSVCGMKRVQINGMKGEYTTVLVDDVPLHSTVSSYYGFDALTTAGVARIEVARGAGASLLAPGAIGGAINIITQKATENKVILDVSGGNAGNYGLSLVGTGVSEGGSRRALISAQTAGQGQWDVDKNGISESPSRKNYSLMLRLSDDLGSRDNVDLRLMALRADTIGGASQDASTVSPVLNVGTNSFTDGDVRKKYTGGLGALTEVISTQRQEAITRWTHRFGEQNSLLATASLAKQIQDSFYEGNDYYHFNETYYGDLKTNLVLSENTLTTLGFDARKEILRSSSVSYFASGLIPKDDFDFKSLGLYAQNTWRPSAAWEIALVLRGDYLAVDWKSLTAKQNEIEKWVLVPRAHIRWNHTEELTSRLSVGKGYRAPLTFFESEHGILDRGFGVNISDIEKSYSAVYSLAYDNKRLTSVASLSWTNIEGMAYLSTANSNNPLLQTDPQKHDVYTADITLGYGLLSNLSLGTSYEHFLYPNSYKKRLPVAAVEDRIRFMVDYDQADWEANITANLVGDRDLSTYNYANRYNIKDAAGNLSAAKKTRAPWFVTLDTKISWKFQKGSTFYFGIKNLLDYTQASTENALYYNADGKFDVNHIWGPNRGREVYVGLQVKL